MVINHLLNGMILQVYSLCPIFWPLILTSWNKQIAPALSPRSSPENPSNRKLQASKVLGQERRYDKASNQSLGEGWLVAVEIWVPCNFWDLYMYDILSIHIFTVYIYIHIYVSNVYNCNIIRESIQHISKYVFFRFPYILTCWNLWKKLEREGVVLHHVWKLPSKLSVCRSTFWWKKVLLP